MQYIIGNVLTFGGAFVMLVGLGGAGTEVQKSRVDWGLVCLGIITALVFGAVMFGGAKLAGWF